MRDHSSTQYPSSVHDHSINSAAILNKFEIESQTKSLAQCCPKCICCSIPILAILGVIGFMFQQGFDCYTSITDVNITIKDTPTPHVPFNSFPSLTQITSLMPYESYEIKKVINGPSVPTSIQWYWSGNAHYNAVLNCFFSLILPFLSGIILIHLFLVRFRIKNQKYRTVMLCVLIQTGKFAFTQPFCEIFDGIINFVNINNEMFQFEIISAPANEYANYCFACSLFGVFATLFLSIDQYFMYDDKILNVNSNNSKKNVNDKVGGIVAHGIRNVEVKCSYYEHIQCIYPNDKWFCLVFVNKRKSKCAVFFDAIFYTVLCASLWLVLEALYTAQVGFTIGGLFGQGAVIIKSAQNIGVTASDYLVLTNAMQKIFVEQFMIIAVIMPLVVQSLIVLVWFIPLKVFLFRWVIRTIFILQSLNALEVYLLAALLCFEFRDYTAWFSANKGGSPGLCGVGTPVYENMGGCIYADPFFNGGGVALMIIAICVQWFTFIYTIHTANKIGINVLRFK